MEAACLHTADILHFRLPYTPHTVAFMEMELTLHTEDPEGVGDTLNIFSFPYLSPLAGLDLALLTRKWDAILGGGNSTYFTDTSLLIGKKKAAPTTGWDKAAYQLEAWDLF